MRLMIDIPNTAYEAIQAVKNIAGSNEGSLENVLIKAVEDGISIPDKATNGDVIKAMFPSTSLHICEKSHTVWVGYEEMSFRIDWWNAPYQKSDTNG